MALQNTDADSLQEDGITERDVIVVACLSLLAVCIVLVAGCAICRTKRVPKAVPPTEQSPKEYDDLSTDIPGSDPFLDSDGYSLPMDMLPDTKQVAFVRQGKNKSRRSLQDDKETVLVTNLGAMTKVSVSCEKLNSISWTLDTNGGRLEKDTQFVSVSTVGTVPVESRKKNTKRVRW